jgi:hypothetical protein
MAKPVERARRLLALQEQLHRVEHWKLLNLQRRGAELAAEREALIAALNDDDALQGLFLAARARRLTSLAQEADSVTRATEAQGVVVGEQATRVACAERHRDAVEVEARRQGERQALGEVIDTLVAGATQASRKIGPT